MQSQVQVMCRCDVGLNPLKGVQGQESTSLCHGQIWRVEKTQCLSYKDCSVDVV